MNLLHFKRLGATLLCLMMLPALWAQDETPFITVFNTHWNMDNEDGSREDWLAIEKEYHEKVTMKNEFIQHANFLSHYYTGDNSEAIGITSYSSWADIEKASKRSGELAEEAWPDEAERKAFFKKRRSYYVNKHSDEIFSIEPNGKLMEAGMDTISMVIYVQTRHMAFPEDGDEEEYAALRKEYVENVEHKNPYIHAFYNYRHAWGSDNLAFIEVRVYSSLSDIEAGNKKIGELIEAHWPDEEERKAFFDKYDRYWADWHGDFIYRDVPGLRK